MIRVAVIGGGPAGLMLAERLSTVDGLKIDIFEAKPSVGRKFLMAGKGGMNITHAEPLPSFIARYGAEAAWVAPWLQAWGPEQIRAWMQELGIDSFVGSSGRVFPEGMKAAPLLRAWLGRLRQAGVQFHVRHRWLGWSEAGALRFEHPAGLLDYQADICVLALGGGSWPQLGSDGRWVPLLQAKGVRVQALQAANCGFECAWSPHFATRWAGAALKTVFAEAAGQRQQGDISLTAYGLEGGLVYALSRGLRETCAREGAAILCLDLAPGRSAERLQEALAKPRGRDSWSTHLRRCTGLDGVKTALLREVVGPEVVYCVPADLARHIKSLPLRLERPRPLAEAISSAGGVCAAELTPDLMLKRLPGVWCIGEMLDWEAPTGGYLLTACFSSAVHAAEGIKQRMMAGLVQSDPVCSKASGEV